MVLKDFSDIKYKVLEARVFIYNIGIELISLLEQKSVFEEKKTNNIYDFIIYNDSKTRLFIKNTLLYCIEKVVSITKTDRNKYYRLDTQFMKYINNKELLTEEEIEKLDEYGKYEKEALISTIEFINLFLHSLNLHVFEYIKRTKESKKFISYIKEKSISIRNILVDVYELYQYNIEKIQF